MGLSVSRSPQIAPPLCLPSPSVPHPGTWACLLQPVSEKEQVRKDGRTKITTDREMKSYVPFTARFHGKLQQL